MKFSDEIQSLLSMLLLKPVKEITERRGAKLLQVVDAKGVLSALKIVDMQMKPTDDAYNPIEVLENEIVMTKLLQPNLYIASGKTDALIYLQSVWFEGGSLSDNSDEVLREEKDTVGKVRGLCSLMIRAAVPLDNMHRAGYLHGDIQPRHFLVGSDSLEFSLIDLGLTQAFMTLPFPYRGAMLHYNAPEVCKELLACGTSTALCIASEVYSFGAMIYVLATNQSVVPKDALESYELGLKAIANGEFAPVPDDSILNGTELGELTQTCLSMNPSKRPQSIQEVKSALNSLC